ncbi:MAG: hypothetical protein NC201_07640 [Prevotella sp.]|nr:hypothetical protein [Bacteroides sp.]MCM1367100.1 hypothetical protein [Prevotella sp.]MCM1437365.1 hypothetical protein [Prevotella sp.]
MRFFFFDVIIATLVHCTLAATYLCFDNDITELWCHSESQMLNVSDTTIDSTPFIILKMNPQSAYIAMADSVIPSIDDKSIALCVEAAFTGELLREFKTTNVGGNYVIEGVFRKGYKCRANTGFLYADRDTFIISALENQEKWIDKAKVNRGTLFQQILIIKENKNVYNGFPIKPSTTNIYRSACILNDGNFAVIQSAKPIPFNSFIRCLTCLGVKDALYLDMGKGWNYGWYRYHTESDPIVFFDYRTPYQTNWLLIKHR